MADTFMVVVSQRWPFHVHKYWVDGEFTSIAMYMFTESYHWHRCNNFP